MRRWRCVVALALLPWSATVIAQDAYDTVSAAACERMKSCALRNMQDVPPEYRDMLTQGLESMCAYLPSSDTIPGFNATHPSYRASLACLKSIAETSCGPMSASAVAVAPTRVPTSRFQRSRLRSFDEAAGLL